MRVDLERAMLAVSDRERQARSIKARGVLGGSVPAGFRYGAVLRRAAGCYLYECGGDFADGDVRAVQSRTVDGFRGAERHCGLRQG
jgi:hypothetical protein